MADKESLIRFDSLNLGYGRRTVLRDVRAEITAGNFLGIVGPNGSGKTTLLRSILGWVRPFSGRIWTRPGTRFGYVPQRSTVDYLYPLTSHDIVLMGLYGRRPAWQRLRAEDHERAEAALDRVGLKFKSGFLFSQLSGGQQQRVLLARALVGEPDILILDEPTNGMDLVSEASVMDTVESVHKKTGMTTLLVTHLLHVVARHADHVGLIQGDRIVFGTTEALLTSRHLTDLYGTPITVSRVGNRTVVMTDG